jgi:hypothetical protein
LPGFLNTRRTAQKIPANMKIRKKKKQIVLHECSECKLPFDIDELKILWKEFRLVCKGCFDKINE